MCSKAGSARATHARPSTHPGLAAPDQHNQRRDELTRVRKRNSHRRSLTRYLVRQRVGLYGANVIIVVDNQGSSVEDGSVDCLDVRDTPPTVYQRTKCHLYDHAAGRV
jgi:hypothetical protein